MQISAPNQEVLNLTSKIYYFLLLIIKLIIKIIFPYLFNKIHNYIFILLKNSLLNLLDYFVVYCYI